MTSRIQEFQKILKSKNLDGFIVTNPINIFYLTGFKGVMPTEREAILSVTPQGTTLVTAKLYQSEAMQVAAKHLRIKIATERNQMLKLLARLLSQTHLRGEVQVTPREHLGGGRIGFEENDLTYGEFQKFKKELTAAKLVPCKDLIENLRVVKTQDEIAKVEKAQIISQKAFEKLIKTIKIGQTEEEIAQNLASIIKSLGGQGLAFESIVASGPNSGKPHHVTSNRRLTINDILLLDFGAKYQNYCADLSRTIFIGKTKHVQRNIYHHVLTAQSKAIAKVSHGLSAHKAYHVANNYFKKHKLEKFFLHGLGHGIGLDVHEAPHLRPDSEPHFQTRFGTVLQTGFDNKILTENMVFSVEPGLYFDWGGVRIEDLVVIQNGKAKVLGKFQEKTIEI